MRALPAATTRAGARLLRELEAALDGSTWRDVPGVGGRGARACSRRRSTLPARSSSLRVVGVGHAHIDSAWLWPIRETVRKCARTFASAVRLMDDDPDYGFTCSQAAQYDWMERLYPELFERIRAKVAAGQFVPVGGMWVEADMNLPSGESIVRQLVHGQRYFESRFGVALRRGVDPRRVRLPGVAAADLRRRRLRPVRHPEAELEQAEPLPAQHVLVGGHRRHAGAHPLPAGRHVQRRGPAGARCASARRTSATHGWSDWALMPYGYGNGGGGPTREMLERARRMADLDGAPRLTLGTAADFFDAVEAEIAGGAPVPVWRGELYFEMHRGTLTSQTRTKVGNRRCERLLREAELWWALVGAMPDGRRRRARPAVEGRAARSSSTTSSPARRSRGSTPTPRRRTRVSPPASRSSIARGARPRWRRAAPRRRSPTPPRIARREVVDVARRADDGRACRGSASSRAGSVGRRRATCRRTVVTTEHTMTQRARLRAVGPGRHDHLDHRRRAGARADPRGRAVVTSSSAPDHPVEYDAWDLESWTRGLGTPDPRRRRRARRAAVRCAPRSRVTRRSALDARRRP